MSVTFKIQIEGDILSLDEAAQELERIERMVPSGQFGAYGRHLRRKRILQGLESATLSEGILERLRAIDQMQNGIFPSAYFEREFSQERGFDVEDVRAAIEVLELNGFLAYQNGYLVLTEAWKKRISVSNLASPTQHTSMPEP